MGALAGGDVALRSMLAGGCGGIGAGCVPRRVLGRGEKGSGEEGEMSRDGGKEGRDALHVRDLLGHDQPVVPDQRLARRPHAVLPVERQRNVGP